MELFVLCIFSVLSLRTNLLWEGSCQQVNYWRAKKEIAPRWCAVPIIRWYSLGTIPVVLFSTGSCAVSPRDSPGMGGTAKEKELIWTRERILHLAGYSSASFQFPKQKDFLPSWACCFVPAASAVCAEWTFHCHHVHHLSVLCPSRVPPSLGWKKWCRQLQNMNFGTCFPLSRL